MTSIGLPIVEMTERKLNAAPANAKQTSMTGADTGAGWGLPRSAATSGRARSPVLECAGFGVKDAADSITGAYVGC